MYIHSCVCVEACTCIHLYVHAYEYTFKCVCASIIYIHVSVIEINSMEETRSKYQSWFNNTNNCSVSYVSTNKEKRKKELNDFFSRFYVPLCHTRDLPVHMSQVTCPRTPYHSMTGDKLPFEKKHHGRYTLFHKQKRSVTERELFRNTWKRGNSVPCEHGHNEVNYDNECEEKSDVENINQMQGQFPR